MNKNFRDFWALSTCAIISALKYRLEVRGCNYKTTGVPKFDACMILNAHTPYFCRDIDCFITPFVRITRSCCSFRELRIFVSAV